MFQRAKKTFAAAFATHPRGLAFGLAACLLLAAPRAQAVVGDCNNNGVLDVNEASWNDRDDDGDGVCNGSDNCPYESNADQAAVQIQNNTTSVGAKCQMAAIAVPWVPSNTTVPHVTYSGASHKLKGIARYGSPDQFKWDYGDGGSTGWLGIAAQGKTMYDLSWDHVFTGADGQLFIATLSVRNSAYPTEVATSQYWLKVQKSDPTQLGIDFNQMDVRINMAIDAGLWNLHTRAIRPANYGDGSPGYAQPYAYWDNDEAGTCAAVDAFELHGSKPTADSSIDPYVEDTRRGLNWMLNQATVLSIPGTTADAPAHGGNGNGLGVRFGPGDNRETYLNGICGVGFTASAAKDRIASVGPSGIYGRSYKDIAQDMVEWLAYGQIDSGSGQGSWYYYSIQGSGSGDGSTNQWPILAMAGAEDNFGVTVPDFVRTEMAYWWNYSRDTARDGDYGGWGYSGPNSIPNIVKTAAGMLEGYFLGNSVDSETIQAGLGFIYRRWNDNNAGQWYFNLGNTYTMYGVMKAMRKPQPNITRIVEQNYTNSTQTSNSFDWYYTPNGQANTGLATWLVNHQDVNGGWTDTTTNYQLSYSATTGWDVIILNKGVTTIPPQAAICNCSATWERNSPITLDGNCSSDSDSTRIITKWDWDYNYNGSTFNQSLDQFNFPVTGQVVTKPDGFSSYTQLIDGTSNGTVHKVALRVTDNNPLSLGGPNSSIATCDVQVKPPPHCPQAVAGGAYRGSLGGSVTLDATKSSDVDHDPITYQWDLQNNGTFVDGPGVLSTSSTAFGAGAGTFVIGLKVTDHPLLNDAPYSAPECSVVAYSTVEIGAHAPVANAGGPYSVIHGQSIQFDASGSYDPDGLTDTYAWDYGSGNFTDSNLVKPTFAVDASVPKGTNYTVCVKVSNINKNATSCAAVNVVNELVAPVVTVLQTNVVKSCNGAGLPVQLDASRSIDGNGNNDPLTFNWTTTCASSTFDNATVSIPTLTIPTFQMGCGLTCKATVTVTDKLHTQLVTSQDVTINVSDDQPPKLTAKPVNTTIECDPNTPSAVIAWLGGAAATDACAPNGSSVAITNDFFPNASLCGGVGVGNSSNVTWTAKDICSNNTSTTTAKVTIVDTTKPVLTLPASFSVEATKGTGANVSFTTSAFDFVTTSPAVVCTPASGSLFAIDPTTSKTTTVACTSTDTAGNIGTGSFTITVKDTTAPVLTLPTPIVVEATKPTGADVPFVTTAADIVDGSDPVTCLRGGASVTTGATFPIGATTTGVTTVNCSTTDQHGNLSAGSFTVSVKDTTPPVLAVPASVLAEATDSSGAIVTFAASAADLVDGATVVNCSPTSGSVFPIGSTAVNCTSVDQHANTGSKSFFVTVKDTSAPILSGANLNGITLEATSGAGATLTNYGITANDKVDGSLPVTCTMAPPALFPLGTTTVVCAATDSHGNKVTASLNVSVVDTTGPAMACPAAISLVANGPAGAEDWGTLKDPTSAQLAAFLSGANATDLVDAIPTVTNDVPALLPIGQTTTVTFTGKDSRLNSNLCTSTVTVTTEVEPQPVLTCPTAATLSVGAGARIDWTSAFRRPVAVELIVLSGNDPGTASPLAVFESGDRQAQLTSSATATGSFAVRLRATDEVSGTTIECNRFISLLGPGMAGGPKSGQQSGRRLAP